MSQSVSRLRKQGGNDTESQTRGMCSRGMMVLDEKRRKTRRRTALYIPDSRRLLRASSFVAAFDLPSFIQHQYPAFPQGQLSFIGCYSTFPSLAMLIPR